MSNHFKSALSFAMLLFLAVYQFSGCTQDINANDPQDPALESDHLVSQHQRITSPDVSQEQLDELVHGNTSLAFDLFHQLGQTNPGQNLFISPHSISIALAMTYAGARSETKTEMATVMHFTLPDDQLHSTFNLLDLRLSARGEGAAGMDGEPFRLDIVNQLWGQIGYPFEMPFIDLLGLNYGAGLRLLDFAATPEEARQTINQWIAEMTEELIDELLPEGTITPLTRLVLTNCIYFNAAWSMPFPEELTRDGDFHSASGSTATLPMMHLSEYFAYTEGDGYQVAELPYDGEEVSMLIILPASGRFDEIAASMSANRLSEMTAGLELTYLALTLPRFEMNSHHSLKESFEALGMVRAFDENQADFSGMANAREILVIADVIHQATVTVTEAGTEAAGATAVIMEGRGAPTVEAEMIIDRPFLTLIRDLETGSVLFLGRYLTP